MAESNDMSERLMSQYRLVSLDLRLFDTKKSNAYVIYAQKKCKNIISFELKQI